MNTNLANRFSVALFLVLALGGSAPARADDAVTAYEQRHRQAALAAQRDGRLIDALWHWDIVLALQPYGGDAQRGRAQAVSAASALAADRHAKARAAHQKGELDDAEQLYLNVLANVPTHQAAADALRDIERTRTRRGHVHALPLMRAADARARTGKPGKSDTAAERNEAEYESLMSTPVDAEPAERVRPKPNKR